MLQEGESGTTRKKTIYGGRDVGGEGKSEDTVGGATECNARVCARQLSTHRAITSVSP